MLILTLFEKSVLSALGLAKSKEIFTDLLELTGEEGARKLIQQNKEKLALIDFPNGAFDLDTPEDYASFIRRN